MSKADDIAAIFRLATDSDHVVTRAALLEAGVDRRSIDRHRAVHLLRTALPGVYLVGATELSQRQLFRVGLAYGGPVCALASYSAGEQREVVRPYLGRATIATARRGLARPVVPLLPMSNGEPGTISFKRTSDRDFREANGLSVVSVPRMLMEIAAAGGQRSAERAWREAAYRKLLDVDELRRALRTTRRAGAPILRAILDTLPAPVDPHEDIRSRHEIAFLDMLDAAGFERPEVNVPMTLGGERYVADFFYRRLGLVVEVDDPSHREPVAAGRDRIRDAEFLAAGLSVVRFETHRLKSHGPDCLRQLAGAMERQRVRVAAEEHYRATHPETVSTYDPLSGA